MWKGNILFVLYVKYLKSAFNKAFFYKEYTQIFNQMIIILMWKCKILSN